MSPRWTGLAAGWLAAVGLLLLAVTTYGFLSSRWFCGEGGNSFGCDLATIGSVLAAIVVGLHLLSAAGIWRGQAWAVVLGAIIAALGVLGCLGMQDGEEWWTPLLLVGAVGYGATFLALAWSLIQGLRGRPTTGGDGATPSR